MCVRVCVRVGGWVCACVRVVCARVCVRVRVYEYVGVILYMDALFRSLGWRNVRVRERERESQVCVYRPVARYKGVVSS